VRVAFDNLAGRSNYAFKSITHGREVPGV
jgi:hypothetical protein